MSTLDNVYAVLQALAQFPRDQQPSSEEIAKESGLEADQLNDAMGLLENRGWAEALHVLGTAPYDFATADITPEGRLEFERLAVELADKLTDFGAPTNKWSEVDSRLRDLGEKLNSARVLDDWRDVGNRSRLLIIEAVNVVLLPSTVPDGSDQPKGDDAKVKADHYLQAAIPGSAHLELRQMLRKALDLAHAVTHSSSITDVDAFAVAQATVLIVRCLQKIDGASPTSGDSPSLGIRIQNARRISGEDDPAVQLVLMVENLRPSNDFVDHFEVEMLEPFEAQAVRFEYRSDHATPMRALSVNVGAHSVSAPLVVMAFFDQRLSYDQSCRGRVIAVGRAGTKGLPSEFRCDALA